MIKTTALATVTAIAIAAGSLGATTSSASAAGLYFQGNGYGIGVHFPAPTKKICHPIFKKKKVWTKWGWKWKTIKVGYKCEWVPIYPWY